MPFFLVDFVVSGISLLFTVSLAVLATWWIVGHFSFPNEFAGILKLFFFFLSIILITGIYGRIIQTILPIQEGTFSIARNDRKGVVWKLQGFLNLFNLSILIHTYLMPVNLRWLVYRFLGSKIGKNVIIGGKILEPLMIEVGDYTIFGEDSLVTGHSIEGEYVTLDRVKIGNYVTIGVKAVILPGVEIGDHSLIAAGAVVSKNTKIGQWEIWGGIPAKKIGERKRETPTGVV